MPVTKPIGQWNSLHIHCQADRIRTTVNGIQLVDANMRTNVELRDRPRAGYIGITNWRGHANGTAFRNIRIRQLDP